MKIFHFIKALECNQKEWGTHPSTFERNHSTTKTNFFNLTGEWVSNFFEFISIIETMPEIIIFVVALLAAIRGADWVGRASINFAKRLGVSSFVIGATFVAIATTLPELTVALISGVVNKNPLYGLGNVLGSPIINIGLILGGFHFE